MRLGGPPEPRGPLEHQLVRDWDRERAAGLGRDVVDEDRDQAMADGTHPLSRRSRFARGEPVLPGYSYPARPPHGAL